MRICIVAEGSYPYVTGGVSSWINTLIKNCTEHEFIIYALSADSENQGKYKYKIPENVCSIEEVYFDKILLDQGKKGMDYQFTEVQHNAILNLLRGKADGWLEVFRFFKNVPFKDVEEFFMSRDFFNIVRQVYMEDYSYTPFTEFIWTMRSMYLPLFYMMTHKIPKADIYHSVSTGYAGIVASYGKMLYDKPFILTEHGIYTREREEEIIKSTWVKGYYKDTWIRLFDCFSSCAYDNADVVTSLFELSRELQIELGCSPYKMQVIPNGVNVEAFKELPVDEDRKTINIGAIVRVVPIKDLKTMLRSFEVVQREMPDVHFYIMGPSDEDPEYNQECLDLVASLRLKNVEFTGTVDIRKYLGKLDIMVLSSISEGQPLAVMEAMAAGKPHVCTNVGDCKGLIQGYGDSYGEAGFIEYIMDHEGIGRSIIRLAKDENLRKTMGENAKRRIDALYRHDTFLNKYKQLYKEVGEGKAWQE